MAKGDEPASKRSRAGGGDGGAGAAGAANGGATLKPPAALAKPAAGGQFGELMDSLRGLIDEGGGDEAGDQVEEELRAAVGKVLEARAHKAQKKQRQQLEQLQAAVAGQVRQLEQDVRRDAAETSAALAAMMKGLRAKLEAKMRAIQELDARFQKELQARWDEYNELYSTHLDEMSAQADKLVAKKAAGHKRRLDAISAEAASKLAELEARFAKSRSKSDSLPNIADILKVYL